MTALVGSALVLSGMAVLVGVAVDAGQASADTAPFELVCADTPIGNLAVNDVVITGALSPAAPSPGQQFNLENFQAQVTTPADVAQAAAAVGNTSLVGTVTATISAVGATPSNISTQALSFDQPIPDPVPPSGLLMDVPTTPATIGPFTATSQNVSVALDSSLDISFTDVALPGLPPFKCSAYPNDVVSSGLVGQVPAGLPISPVIAFAGTPPPPPSTNALTGPYELYCPGTPVGDLDFNGVTTSATVSPTDLSAGDRFNVTDYAVDIPVPAGPVSSAVGLSNNSFDGLATSSVDAYGASPSEMATGSLGFDVPIPDPVPSSGVDVEIPASPTTIGPFTADGGPVTMAQNQSILVVAELSGKAFRMSCSSYPNDSLATSGSTTVPPPGTPIRPVIAIANAWGTPVTTTTTVPGGGVQPQTPGAPYELYCPGTPVGDIVVNDVATTGSISPAGLKEGDSFQMSGLQTQFSIPQATAEQLEKLGLTTLSGDLALFLYAQGSQYQNYGYGYTSGSGSVAVGPFPVYPSGTADMTFSVTLPSPVPASGVRFTATPPAGFPPPTWVAAGGPIEVDIDGANLDVTAFGDRFGLFCDTLSDNSVPDGLSISEPYNDYTTPVVATGTATVIPPPPAPPGAYELYCPNTPVGNVALNDVSSSGTIPQTLSAGQSFDLSGYQTTLTIPQTIVAAAAALGNTAITGNATATIGATGATPSTLSTGTLAFDVPIPTSIPTAGITLSVPSTPENIGPFTAAGATVSIEQYGQVDLTLVVSGNALSLNCAAYPDNTLPEGIVPAYYVPPSSSPISPVIATSGPTLIVTPAAGLTNGESVSVTGSGFADDSIGNVLECNDAAGQPTVQLPSPVNSPVDVGCTAPAESAATLATTSATGTLSKSYTVTAGTVGPPCGTNGDIVTTCPSADSAGKDPASDAADYPCPPTPAQVAAGVSCVLDWGDQAGDFASAAISFSTGSQPPPPDAGVSTPYELYCPGTPVGNIALNDVSTTGTITPATPVQGDQFQVDGYQTTVALPAAIASAAAALGNVTISGSAQADVAVTGATPDSFESPYSFDVPIPNPVPSSGVTLTIPSTSTDIGPFTATGGPITVSESQQTQLTLIVSGNSLNLTCTAYANNSVQSGIVSGAPSGSPISPTIATEGGTQPVTTPTTEPQSNSTSTTTTSTTPTSSSTTTSTTPASSSTTTPSTSVPSCACPTSIVTTTDPNGTPSITGSPGNPSPVAASSGSLAFTGTGAGLRRTAVLGAMLVVLGLLLLAVVDAPRQLLRRVAAMGAGRVTDVASRRRRRWQPDLPAVGSEGVGDRIGASAPTDSHAGPKSFERWERLLGR